MNSTIKLRSGLYIDLLEPKQNQFRFRDFLAVCRICRYGGHCSKWYCVGEHLVLAAEIAKENGNSISAQRAVFAHDFTEAFIGDCVKPLKMAMPNYQAIEAMHEAVIGAKYNIDFDGYHTIIKDIDMALLIAEKNVLFKPDGIKWYYEDKAMKINFRPKFWGPEQAEAEFLKKAEELGFPINE